MNKLLLIALIIGITFCTAADDKVKSVKDVSYKGDWYSGVLDIGKGNKIHYWLFKTYPVLEGAPLQIWLSGGPGCSSLIDATGGNGPFVFADKSTTNTFDDNDYAWNLHSNMLYMDAPGVGYSIRGETNDDYEGDTDNQTVEFFYEALLKFYERFDEYKLSDLFIGGSNYGGNYAALLTEKILLLNQNPTISDKIQIRGLINGNAVVTQSQVERYYKEFPYNFVYFLKHMGIIAWQDVEDFQEVCGYDANDFSEKSEDCDKYVTKIRNKTYGLNTRDINADCNLTDLGGLDYDCLDDDHIDPWFNDSNVRKNLHVDEDAGDFTPCNSDLKYKEGYGSLFVYPTIIKGGIRVWTYTGDADAEIPFNSTIKWITTLREDMGLADIVSHSSWFFQPNDKKKKHLQNGGGYWRMDGLTYVSFRSCGMDVAKCNPEGSQLMYKKFVNRQEMPMDPFDFKE